MKELILIAIALTASGAFAQTNPFASISGTYNVISCSDKSATENAAGNLCASKTVFIGVLPGDKAIGARFVDIDYVVFNAKCGDPVVCTDSQISSVRQIPEFEDRKLTTDIRFSRQDEKTLNIHFRRQLIPKASKPGKDLDAEVDLTVKKQNQ